MLTLTADNGKEFANHQQIAEALNGDFFFAKPYHSWERGLNEHTNGLVRQYFPKSMAFDKVTQDQLDEVEILLNNRPRKVPQYLTPNNTATYLNFKVVALNLRRIFNVMAKFRL